MLVIISGGLGSGKTLLSTLFAIEDSRPLYANYKVNLDRYHHVTPAVIDKIDSPSLVILDEIYAWINARISSSDVNLYMAELLLQSRKRKLDIVGTLQLTRTLDVIFREMADFLIKCKKLDDGFGYELWDVPKERKIKQFKITLEQAKLIYPYYDTWQKVSSIHRYKFIASDMDEFNNVLDQIIKEIQPNNIKGTYQKEKIRDWLLRHSYPTSLYTHVYDRLVSNG